MVYLFSRMSFFASLILIFGLNLLGLIELNLSPLVKKFPKGNSTSLFIYPFIIGALFAFAASPCSTPILAGIMAFAAIGKNLSLAIGMLFLFALGQGVILILAGLFTSAMKNMRMLAKFTEILLKISGGLLVFVAGFLFWKVFAPLI